MASLDASGTEPGRRVRGRRHRAQHRGRGEPSHSSPGCGVSRDTFFLFAWEVAVELAEQGIAVFFGPVGQVLDKILDLGAGGFLQGLGAAEIDRVAFYEFGIEAVLTDELTEAVADARAAAP